MDHRAKQHPSNKICKKIPDCNGWVNGKKCWYIHPVLNTGEDLVTAPVSVKQDKQIECRKCKNKFESKNKFMHHYTTNHTSHIICRDWLKNNCTRNKCWYRHSNISSSQEQEIAQPLAKAKPGFANNSGFSPSSPPTSTPSTSTNCSHKSNIKSDRDPENDNSDGNENENYGVANKRKSNSNAPSATNVSQPQAIEETYGKPP